ncbi:hypothetical protein EMPS_08546 [Entomortierella parvispora]|uniref:F-box domain-containing protein n=1 Tax=Entomortierella parvispora TaxID=205924 RepID=A0A9P3HH33_9FUNG|nr:hypothetical protein EMPS_08546 [Entomortierella parvispora]
MDYPEIRHRVGLFLAKHDLVACSRVSKEWFETFTPLLFESLDIQAYGPRWSAKAPTMTALRKHGHRIRLLALRENDSYSIAEQDLQPTEDDSSGQEYIPKGLKWIQDFLRDHPRILRLELQDFVYQTSLVPALTMHCLELKELSLLNMTTDIADIAYILKESKHLEALTIADGMLTRAHDGWPDNMPELFPNIKALDFRRIIGPSLGFLLEWVARCPGLEELRIEPGSIHKEYTDTDYTLLEQCPKLARLEIRKMRLVDGELATILDSCSYLTHFTLRGERLNEKAYKALRRHFLTLRVLNFFGTVEMRSWMCGHIVYMCPNLVELTTSDLKLDEFLTLTPPKISRVRDTPSRMPAKKRLTMAESALAEVRGHPWGCKGLRKLKFKSLEWSDDEEVDIKFLTKYVPVFKQLEEFVIGGFDDQYGEPGDMEMLEFRQSYVSQKKPLDPGPLQKGVFDRDRLTRLDNMRWMTKKWPKLKLFKLVDRQFYI